MSSNTVSAVVEKLIRRLCLKDFPCGHGSWRQTADCTDEGETENIDTLLNLLTCPHSPWTFDGSWSPQAAALRRMAVLSPECLNDDFICSFFTTLRVVDKDVSVIDKGLLKFSKLEELVLSANKISEVSLENLPRTLKILELRANCLSALDSLTRCPPPHLHYLGLGSNSLHSQEDISHLTGTHWPHLVCLDLSDCGFKEHPPLLKALSSLPALRTLMLQGNPLSLASCYPGLTVDSLPRLSCLDASRISPDERKSFRGLAKRRDLVMDQASVTVSVGRLSGTTDPSMSVTEKTPDFQFVTYNYFISYETLSNKNYNEQKFKSESEFDGHLTEEVLKDTDLQSNEACHKEMLKAGTCDSRADTENTFHDTTQEITYSTAKLMWSECMDFSDAQTFAVSDLGALKRFLNLGLHLRIEEEKVLLRPAASEDEASAKTSKTPKENKGKKGKESANKSGSSKEKSKDKQKTSVPEVHSSSTRILGSVHVPLHSLVKSGQHVDVLCNFGALQTEFEMEATPAIEKEQGKKMKVKKKEDKDSKSREVNDTREKRTSPSKAKGRGGEESADDVTDDPESDQPKPVIVELRVELQKWSPASEAGQQQL